MNDNIKSKSAVPISFESNMFVTDPSVPNVVVSSVTVLDRISIVARDNVIVVDEANIELDEIATNEVVPIRMSQLVRRHSGVSNTARAVEYSDMAVFTNRTGR